MQLNRRWRPVGLSRTAYEAHINCFCIFEQLLFLLFLSIENVFFNFRCNGASTQGVPLFLNALKIPI